MTDTLTPVPTPANPRPFPPPASAEYNALCAAIVTDSWGEHARCSLVACRAPLHPGPCKGWKHTLHQISPGVWHSLERSRVEQLNTRRVAAVAKLRSEGKPVPKALLTPIEPRTAPAGVPAAQHGQIAKAVTGPAHEAAVAAHPVRPEVAKVSPTPAKAEPSPAAQGLPEGVGSHHLARIRSGFVYRNSDTTEWHGGISNGQADTLVKAGLATVEPQGRSGSTLKLTDKGRKLEEVETPKTLTRVAGERQVEASKRPTPPSQQREPAGPMRAELDRIHAIDHAEFLRMSPEKQREVATTLAKARASSSESDRMLANGSIGRLHLHPTPAQQDTNDQRIPHPSAVDIVMRAHEDAINKERAERGHGPLSPNPRLTPEAKPGAVKATTPGTPGKIPANPIESGRTLDEQARANVEKRAAAKLAATPAGPASAKAASGKRGSAATRLGHYRRLTPEEFQALPATDRANILRDLDVIHRANAKENPTVSAEAASLHTALRTGTAAPSAAPAAARQEAKATKAAPGTVEVADRIRQAVLDLHSRPGASPDWADLADVREHPALAGIPREQVDEALKHLARTRDNGVRVIPIANVKALRDRDRAAALEMGGDMQHAIQVKPQASPVATPDTSHLSTPAGLRAEAKKLEDAGHLVPAAQLTGLAEAVEEGRYRGDNAQAAEQAAAVIERAKTMRVPEWRRAAPKPESTAAPRTLEETAAAEDLGRLRRSYTDVQKAAIEATGGGPPTTAQLDHLERELTAGGFRNLAPVDQERLRTWITSGRGGELGRRSQYLMDHLEGKLEPLTKEDVAALPHGAELRAEVAKRAIDMAKAEQAAARAERKASGIPSDAELKKLPPEERYAAEAILHAIRAQAGGRTAVANNRSQLDAIDAVLARHPETTPEQRRILDRLRSNYVHTLRAKAGRIGTGAPAVDSPELVEARRRHAELRAEGEGRRSIDTAKGLAEAIVAGRIKPGDYQTDTSAERYRRAAIYKAADLSGLSDAEKAAVAEDIATIGGPDHGKITARLGTITHRPTSNPDVLVKETPSSGTGHRITVEHNGEVLHQVDTINRSAQLANARDKAAKVAEHLAAGRNAHGETPEDVAKREAARLAAEKRSAELDQQIEDLGKKVNTTLSEIAKQAGTRQGTKAKPGDLVAVQEERKQTGLGTGGARVYRTKVARVEAVDDQGNVTRYRVPGERTADWVSNHEGKGTQLHVISQDQVEPVAALRATEGKRYQNLDDLRTDLQPHRRGTKAPGAKAATPAAAPAAAPVEAHADLPTLAKDATDQLDGGTDTELIRKAVLAYAEQLGPLQEVERKGLANAIRTALRYDRPAVRPLRDWLELRAKLAEQAPGRTPPHIETALAVTRSGHSRSVLTHDLGGLDPTVLRGYFTPEERTKLRGMVTPLLDRTTLKPQERAGIERTIASLDALDGATPPRATLAQAATPSRVEVRPEPLGADSVDPTGGRIRALESTPLPQLRERAKAAGVKGASRMGKEDLVSQLLDVERRSSPTTLAHRVAAQGGSARGVLHRAIDAPDRAATAEIIDGLSRDRLAQALEAIPASYRSGLGPRSSVADRRRVLVDWATSADQANSDVLRGLGSSTFEQRAAARAQRNAARHAELGGTEAATPSPLTAQAADREVRRAGYGTPSPTGLDSSRPSLADQAAAPTGPLATRVLDVYRRLAGQSRGTDLVALTRLRDQLGDVSRAELDSVLKALDRARVIHLEPDPNRKTFTPEVRESALRVGGEAKHFVRLGAPASAAPAGPLSEQEQYARGLSDAALIAALNRVLSIASRATLEAERRRRGL